MQVPPLTTPARHLAPVRASVTTPPPAETDPQDQVLKSKGLPPHARPLPRIDDPQEIMGLTAPPLLRPVILVHGLAQHADTWVNLKNFLVAEPSNRYGGTYSTKTEGKFMEGLREHPEANVFAIDISDNLASPADTAAELHRAIGLVAGFTGAKQVDVVTHSMGALVAREAKRQGESRIDHLVMVAPPNQGSYEANISTWLAPLVTKYPGERQGALQALRLERGPLGGVANEYLHGLNEAWKHDSQEVDAAIIVGTGLPTPDRSWTGTSDGDGMVVASRAPLGDTPFFVAEPADLGAAHEHFRDFQYFRYNHLQIASEPEVFAKVCEILTSDPPVEPRAPQQITLWDAFPEAFPPEPAPPTQIDLFPRT